MYLKGIVLRSTPQLCSLCSLTRHPLLTLQARITLIHASRSTFKLKTFLNLLCNLGKLQFDNDLP